MNRSGYSEDCEFLELYRANVERAIRGKRGQAFLRELAAALDLMPEKALIYGELVNESGACGAIGAVCKARGTTIDVDEYCPASVGDLVGVSAALAAEIEFINDCGGRFSETPAQRWLRMRRWVEDQLLETGDE